MDEKTMYVWPAGTFLQSQQMRTGDMKKTNNDVTAQRLFLKKWNVRFRARRILYFATNIKYDAGKAGASSCDQENLIMHQVDGQQNGIEIWYL